MKSQERHLAARFRRGEKTAFDELYRSYGERIFRYCYRLSGNSTDAEDLAQECFVAALQGRERFEGRSSLSTWLYRIALNIWRVHCRRGGRIESIALSEDGEASEGKCDPLRHKADEMALTAAIADLPQELQDALVLVRMEGLTHREAAEILDAPTGTVQSRVFTATRLLRQTLRSDAPDTDTALRPAASPRPEVMSHELR